MHLGKDICVSWKGFLFLSNVDYISFSFYVKYIWKKCYKNFLGAFFWAPIPFKRFKCIWMRHWLEHGNAYSNTASSTSRWQNRCEKANKRQESTLLETIFSVFFQSCLDCFSCADSVIKVMMSSVVMFQF